LAGTAHASLKPAARLLRLDLVVQDS